MRRVIISDLRNIFIISRFDLTQDGVLELGHRGTEVTGVSDSNLQSGGFI